MHRPIAAAAAVVALTAALTACNGSDGDGGKTGSTKGASSSAAAEPGGQKSSEAAPSGGSANSTGAKLGDTLSLTGGRPLGQGGVPTVNVTLNKIVDNAKPALGAAEPEDGSRLVAVEFTIVNTGTAAYGDIPYNPPTVIDAAGGEHSGKPGHPTVGDALGNGMIMNILAGQRDTGWVIFDVPKGVKVTTVTFLMNRISNDPARIGKWTL